MPILVEKYIACDILNGVFYLYVSALISLTPSGRFPERQGLRMTDAKKPTLALFYCQNTPDCGEPERQSLEELHGKSLRLFPVPCSGRLEPLHLLRALEEYADAAHVITCPEGTCRYSEGNRRAKKRVERTQWIIVGIGLEQERVGITIRAKDDRRSLTELAEVIVAMTSKLGPSPVHHPPSSSSSSR
jgi:coenzyme F420-reducing hydrogenase delta subunit